MSSRTVLLQSIQSENPRALDLVQEAIITGQGDCFFLQLATRLCLNTLENPKKAIEFVEQWLKHETSPRAFHAAGITHALLGRVAESEEARVRHHTAALAHLNSAIKDSTQDPTVHRMMYHLALQFAYARDIESALKWAASSIQHNKLYQMPWALLATIHSSQRDWKECNRILDMAQAQFGPTVLLIVLRARVLIVTGKVSSASSLCATALQDLMALDKYLQCVRESSTPPASSQRAFCCVGVGTTRELLRWYCILGETFLFLKEHDNALACCTAGDMQLHFVHRELEAHCEAEVNCVRAKVLLALSRADEAKMHLARSLQQRVHHPGALLMMGHTCFHLREIVAARHYLEMAIRVNPTDSGAWKALAGIHRDQNRLDIASDCLIAAVKLEFTAPVFPTEYFEHNL